MQLLLGNEAIARGIYEAGATVATGYPGTPSTEILENVAKYDDIYSQWAPNEKVALEVALGSSFGGARTVCCMKHVGLNVAADPLFTAAYTGVNGGLVICVADDPGMHSSQNEQDSRYYARAAHIPMLEPSDSQECKDFIKIAFELSETYDTPVFVRLTTRISHSRGLVELADKADVALKDYEKNFMKYVMMPGMARKRHVVVEEREDKLANDVNDMSDINVVTMNDATVGVITSGMAYQYVSEALPDASVLKLGISYPIPMDTISKFAQDVDTLYIVEELEPLFENQIKAAGIDCIGKELFSLQGEYSMVEIKKQIGKVDLPVSEEKPVLPMRPPVLCPGCPHRGTFHAIKSLKLNVTGDIGCYTLGALPPIQSVDTVICMGASIGLAMGMEKARGADFAKKTVAIIGDSTFFHSGITGLVDAVYNKGTTTVIIMDNRTTGMTGHQDHPSTGKNIKGEAAPEINIPALCSAIGVESVVTVDPFDIKATKKAIKDALAFEGPAVVITRRPCVLLDKRFRKPVVHVNQDKCIKCKSCMKLGCPAIVDRDNRIEIDETLCVGCNMCVNVCPVKAIEGEK